MHEITFTLEIPTVPTTVALKEKKVLPKDFMSTLDLSTTLCLRGILRNLTGVIPFQLA